MQFGVPRDGDTAKYPAAQIPQLHEQDLHSGDDHIIKKSQTYRPKNETFTYYIYIYTHYIYVCVFIYMQIFDSI